MIFFFKKLQAGISQIHNSLTSSQTSIFYKIFLKSSFLLYLVVKIHDLYVKQQFLRDIL